MLTFLSAALLNIFIPSGGRQWVIQGPIAMQSATELGVEFSEVARAVMLGDQWSNLIHPLAILPVATLTGLMIRQIVGYSAIALMISGSIFVTALALTSFL